jgi:hypothetical protein
MRRLLRLAPLLLLTASLAALFSPRGARTVPLYAARTGLMCQSCHFDPNGGGPRNEFGFAYAMKRHSLESEPDSTLWSDLALTNRVSDSFPLYIGLDQRFMTLANTTVKSDSTDRDGFYNMENAFYLTFQPHSKLTLVYARDGFNEGSSTKDAYGMFTGLPVNGYLKAGRFRTPFGLRLDDHTVATRNGFLDFFGGFSAPPSYQFTDTIRTRFLPYDPRQDDMGIEVGGERSNFYGRMSYTNGAANPLGPAPYAGAFTAKLGHNTSRYQGQLSYYSDYQKDGTFRQRAMRWGYAGIGHHGPFAVLGEVAAGTDEAEPAPGSGKASGVKTNSLAWFLEGDYAPVRQANVRVRYDWMSLDRGNPDPYVRQLNEHTRVALEAEWVPVPFAELRWTLRFINHEADSYRADNVPIEDETQTYLQFHFSY